MLLKKTFFMKSKPVLKYFFEIDYRAFAFFRISLGVLLFVDLVWRAFDLRAHYTDFGILPRDILQTRFYIPYTFSWHTWGGSLGFQAFLFLIAGALAICVCLGYRTRVALFFSWLFLISLHNRNEIILQGGDSLLRAFLFWSLFLPLGARYSIDAVRAKTKPSTPHFLSVATFAIMLQMVILYEFSAFSKYHPIWFEEGSAIFYALASEQMTKPFGIWLLQFPVLLTWLTFATLFLEIVVPLIAFIPFYLPVLRLMVVLSFWSFHLGLFFSLDIGLFPLICMAGWILYLPSCVWDFLEKKILSRFQFFFRTKEEPRMVPYLPSTGANLVTLFFILYVVLWNFKSLQPDRYEAMVPEPLLPIGYALRLDQKWKLFSPYPSTEQGWYVLVGTLFDGTEIDLLQGSGSVNWEKPEQIYSIYPGHRWRKYFSLLLSETYAEHRLYYVQYLCRFWNESRSQKLLTRIQIYYLKTPLFLDRPSPPPKRYRVWETYCEECS